MLRTYRTWITLFSILAFSLSIHAQEVPAQNPQSPAVQQTEPATTSPKPAEKPAPSPTDSLTHKDLSQSDLRDLVRRAMLNDQENYQKQKDLTHVEHQVTEHLDKQGKVKSADSVTREILILYGRRMEHTLERNDKPLSDDERRKEDGKFDKDVEKLQKESPADRQKRIAKFEEQSRKAREFVTEVANAFDFKFEGEDMVNGRPAYVISGTPRDDYHPSSREGKILSKTRGKMWVDIASTHWVKLDAEFTDAMNFGWFLARVRPGTRVHVEQNLFRDDVWVPSEIKFNLDARVGLFKELFQNVDVTFRDWRKFSTDSKIIDYSEVK